MKPERIMFVAALLLGASIGLSFIHPWGNLRDNAQPEAPLLAGTLVPAEVRQVFEAKCADCHSEKTHWPVYSVLAPGSWLLERDVHMGRQHLDLSRWQTYSRESQVDLLTKIAAEAHNGQMPVKHYLILHPKARLSAAEQQLIYEWAKAERKQIRQQLARLPQEPRNDEK